MELEREKMKFLNTQLVFLTGKSLKINNLSADASSYLNFYKIKLGLFKFEILSIYQLKKFYT